MPSRPARWALLVPAAVGAGWLAAQTIASPARTFLATLSGDSVQLRGVANLPAALDATGRLEVGDGASIIVHGRNAQLALVRGGGVKVCGPARVSLAAGGQGALLLSLDQGAMAMRYASPVSDSILTPDFRVQTVVPPQQLATVSASVGVGAQGTLCVMNRGSALSVERLWDGAQQYVIGGETLAFHPSGGPPTVVPSCPCAESAPAAVTAANPPNSANGAAAGQLFPQAEALSVTGAEAAAGLPSAIANAAPPPPVPPHHNFLVRFFDWLF